MNIEYSIYQPYSSLKLPPQEINGHWKSFSGLEAKWVLWLASASVMVLLPQEIVYEGLHFPAFLDTPSAVGRILAQQPGKMRASQLRQGKGARSTLLVVLIFSKGVRLSHSQARLRFATLYLYLPFTISTKLRVTLILGRADFFSAIPFLLYLLPHSCHGDGCWCWCSSNEGGCVPAAGEAGSGRGEGQPAQMVRRRGHQEDTYFCVWLVGLPVDKYSCLISSYGFG